MADELRGLLTGAVTGAMGVGFRGARAILHAGVEAAEDWLARRNLDERRAREALMYKNWLRDTHLPDNAEWTGIKMVGRGGQGQAGVWFKLDQNKKILDRMVVKESYVNPGAFADDYMWTFPGKKYECPRDAATHAICSPSPEVTNTLADSHGIGRPQPANTGSAAETFPRKVGKGSGIIRLREQLVNRQKMKYRVYMDYASHQDLWRLVTRHRSKRKVPRRNDDGTVSMVNQGPAPIHETYIWFVLYHLMLACKAMEHVEFGRKGEIIHQDIKFENTFLSEPDPEWFPCYPIPRIGDFGSAHMTLTWTGDPSNPRDWAGKDAMTHGYAPGEYRHPDRTRRTSAINVWQCGLVLLGLMQNKDPYFNFHFVHPVIEDLAGRYTSSLIEVVSHLLRDKPASRPKPQQVIDLIERNRERAFPHGIEYRETAKDLYHMHIRGVDDEYKIGMAYAASVEDPGYIPTGMSDSGQLVGAPDFSNSGELIDPAGR